METGITNLSLWAIKLHSEAVGISVDEFLEGLSYSYWEAKGGLNRTVVADSAITGRYHIFTTQPRVHLGNIRAEGCGYSVVEDGQIIESGSYKLPKQLETDLEPGITFYETVRQLGRFDRNHCPIFEVQTAQDGTYFLQYHRTVDFNPASFVLDRAPEDSEVEAAFVRGATPPGGLQLTLGLNYSQLAPQAPTDAGADFHYGVFLTEASVRQRKLQLIHIGRHREGIFDTHKGHLPKSRLFKAGIGAILLSPALEALTQGVERSREDRNPQVKIGIISDGRKAYLKRTE